MTEKTEKALTSHELARLLLEFPDVPVWAVCGESCSYERYTVTRALTTGDQYGTTYYGGSFEITDKYVEFGEQ
jgi:hypothetical protein